MTREQPEKGTPIRVWDLPTRAFHWTLVGLVVLGWITAEFEGAWFWTHLGVGYGVLALIVFRLAWGVLGTRHARFTDFVRPWPEVRDHGLALLRMSPPRHLGHNPLGGWMIVALLSLLFLLVATGLFAGDDGDTGPLASLGARLAGSWLPDALGEVHEGLHAVLWGLVGMHVAGVVVDSLLGGENLVRAMWTGKKNNPQAGGADNLEKAGIIRLVAAIGLAVAAVAVVMG
jgi:cytochrome b